MKLLTILTALLISSCGDSSSSNTPTEITPSAQSIQITWQDNSDNENEFIISRRYSDEVDFTVIEYLPANKTAYIDNDIDSEYNYCYIVTASNNIGQSNSDEACAKY